MVWKGDSAGHRLAKSLITLIDQVDAMWPNRDTSTDGSIGDTAHAARTSDHNPNAAGVVTALDLDRDITAGFTARNLAEMLVASRDPRIKYIISNGQIISSKVSPWVWRPYTGANAHREHIHVSVMGEAALYDDTRPWVIGVQTALPSPAAFPHSGKGSWYSQFSGKYRWVDTGDKPGSAALGVPDDAQGVSFYDRNTLGKWFQVRAPNGTTSLEQQTDIGPHPNTGRLIDIAAVAAERFGYSPQNFPTDSIFSWRPVDPPTKVAGLTPQQQASKFRDLRPGIDGEVLPPLKENDMETDKIVAAVIAALRAQGAIPALPPPPPPPPPVTTGMDMGVLLEPLLKKLTGGQGVTLVDLLPLGLLFLQSRGGQPLLPAPVQQPVVDPPKPVVVVPPPPTPLLEKKGVPTSLAGLGAAIIAMLAGGVGTPFGMGQVPTDTGTASIVVPIISTVLGMTGIWGKLASFALPLLGNLFSKK